jgi:hypothetical protein
MLSPSPHNKDPELTFRRNQCVCESSLTGLEGVNIAITSGNTSENGQYPIPGQDRRFSKGSLQTASLVGI